MKPNSCYEVYLKLLCMVAFMTAVYPRNTIATDENVNALNDLHFRNRRQVNRCFLEKTRCQRMATSPEICEIPGEKCVKVKQILLSCVYVCKPIPTQTRSIIMRNTTDSPGALTSVMINSPGALTNITDNSPGTLTNVTDSPPGALTNVTNNSPGTLTNVTDSPSNTTSAEHTTNDFWLNDPSYCSPGVRCRNGGNCTSTGNEIPVCQCPPGWQGTICSKPCTLDCQNNGTCHNNNGTQACSCPWIYDPATNCAKLKPVNEQEHFGFWYIYVLVFFVLLVCFLVGYLVLRRLRGKSLLVTKVFHFFQPYEDDDGKLFDAFISFKSSNKDYTQSEDEKFVLRTLQPKLEKELQFKTCVHYRDFLPGETIANNIMWAVENSRRTILILSPLYIESEWARLEYQKAQQEMLQLRHKIIPVILEDISDTIIEDPNLKHILSSVTYIEFPEQGDEKQQGKFWEMLELALPKKRSRESPTSSSTTPSFRTLNSRDSWQSDSTNASFISDDSAIEM